MPAALKDAVDASVVDELARRFAAVDPQFDAAGLATYAIAPTDRHADPSGASRSPRTSEPPFGAVTRNQGGFPASPDHRERVQSVAACIT